MAMHTVDPMKALEERKARQRGGLAFDACFSPDRKRAKPERFEAGAAMIVAGGLCTEYPSRPVSMTTTARFKDGLG